MWRKEFSKFYDSVTREQIWRAWEDVTNWPRWDEELDYCDFKGDFTEGNQFILKPTGGPKVKIVLSRVVRCERFLDYCRFPGALMYDDHTLVKEQGGVRITNVISVKGPLSFVWTNLVVKKVAQSVPKQTDNLVEYVRRQCG